MKFRIGEYATKNCRGSWILLSIDSVYFSCTCILIEMLRSQGSSGTIVSKIHRGSILGRGSECILHLHHRVQTGSRAHLAFYPVGIGSYFPGGKAAGAWSWTLTCIWCQYVLMVWCLIKQVHLGVVLLYGDRFYLWMEIAWVKREF
jgi:hypothetical protein